MATQQYLLALGENRWAFAAVDYEFAFLLMTMDPTFQAQVDSPATYGDVVTSGKLGELLLARVGRANLPSNLKDEAKKISVDWATLTEHRNNLAHAWGYSDANNVSQLGGYSHKFPRTGAPIHKHMVWPIEELQRMTDECWQMFERIRRWRLEYEEGWVE